MNIQLGCGNEGHSQWWYSGQGLNIFCGYCGKRVLRAIVGQPREAVKIQITQTKDSDFSCLASYRKDNRMHFIGNFADPQCAVEYAKEKARNFHPNSTQFEWEVWLDTPVTSRDNRRVAPWEKLEA